MALIIERRSLTRSRPLDELVQDAIDQNAAKDASEQALAVILRLPERPRRIAAQIVREALGGPSRGNGKPRRPTAKEQGEQAFSGLKGRAA